MITNCHRNIMGTVSFDGKFAGKADIYGAHPEDAIGGHINGPNDEHIFKLPLGRSAIRSILWQFIVKACNSHEALVDALRLVVREVECYCVSEGVANKGPCAHCLAQAALNLAGKEGG